MEVLTPETVRLGAHAASKADAIRQAGEMLVEAGYAAPRYVDGMLAREHMMSTYLGNGIAIPHGEFEDLQAVYRTGVSVLQLAEGVEWEPGERAYLVVGLAATPTSQQHVVVLTNLLQMLQTPGAVTPLVQARDPRVIVERLTRTAYALGERTKE
jgi:mannitol/fructose-specific phosphotransferase system IIA component